MALKRPLVLLCLLIVTLLAPAAAQELRIGVVIPQASAEAQAATEAFVRRLTLSPSPALRGIEVLVRRTAAGAEAAMTAAVELVTEQGVHALVCCTEESASAAVVQLAETEQVLVMSPRGRADDAEAPRLAVTLSPSQLSVFRAIAIGASHQGGGIGMLVPDGPTGDAAEEALRAGALEAGIAVTRVEQFAAGTSPLTPEALLVATSLPSSVVVWANGYDSRNAVDALRARGFDGPVWLRYPEAAGLADGFPVGQLQFVVPPVLLATGGGADPRNHAAVSSYRAAASGGLVGGGTGLEGALVHDALSLVLAAFEQALAYGVSPQNTAQFRQAVADGLLSAGTVPLAAGTYRFDGERGALAQPAGLIPASGRGGRFVNLQ
mgnify:CR=1 FL=1